MIFRPIEWKATIVESAGTFTRIQAKTKSKDQHFCQDCIDKLPRKTL